MADQLEQNGTYCVEYAFPPPQKALYLVSLNLKRANTTSFGLC